MEAHRPRQHHVLDVAADHGELLGAVGVIDPFDGMQVGPALRDARVRQEAASYLTACGLAMRRFMR